MATTDKSVTIQEIGSKVVDEEMTSNKVVPAPGHYIGKPMVKRVTTGGGVRIESYAYAHKWDGRARSETKAEFGH